jgi:Mce-associated membrane protein
MVVSPALDQHSEVTPPDGQPPEQTPAPRAPLFRVVLLGVLVVALVASVVTGLVLAPARGWLVHRTASDSLQADREAAMAQTQQFVMRVNTYGPGLLDDQGQMPTYRSRVKAVITPKFAVSFDKSVTLAEQSVKSYGLARTCAVFSTGVEVIDSDSATVLVAGSISQTAKNRQGKRVSAGEPSPFRLRVSLDKIDGTWLVDDYQPVTTS